MAFSWRIKSKSNVIKKRSLVEIHPYVRNGMHMDVFWWGNYNFPIHLIFVPTSTFPTDWTLPPPLCTYCRCMEVTKGVTNTTEEKIVRKYKIGKTKIKLDLRVNANKMNFNEHFLAEELWTLLWFHYCK